MCGVELANDWSSSLARVCHIDVPSTDVAERDGPGSSCLRLFLLQTCWRGCLLPADVKLLNSVIVRVDDVQRPMAIDGQTVRSEKLARFSPLVLTKAA
jgi:hypothetical protein